MKPGLANVHLFIELHCEIARTDIINDHARNKGPESTIYFAKLEATSFWQTPDVMQHSVKFGYNE